MKENTEPIVFLVLLVMDFFACGVVDICIKDIQHRKCKI